MHSLGVREGVVIAQRIRLYKRPAGGPESDLNRPLEDIWRLVAEGTNLLTNAGRTRAHELLWGQDTTYFAYLALGSDATTPALTQTALVSENAASRIIFTGISISNSIAVLKVYFGPAYGNGTINEWGILTAANGGTMWNRGLVEPTVTKTNTEEMLVEVISTIT